MIPGSLVSSFRVVSHTVATPAPRCVLDSQSTSVVRRPLWRHGGPRERPRVRAAAADWQSSDDFNKLHSELNRAVDAEDYAQAASIRDEIKKKMVESGIDEGPTDWREMGLLSWLIDRWAVLEAAEMFLRRNDWIST